MMGHGTTDGKAGLLGGDTGRPCPLDADAAAMAFVKQYRPAFDWAINEARLPIHERGDVRQDVIIRILGRFRKYGVLHSDGSHLSYAISVARSAIVNHIRARRQNRPSVEDPTMERWLGDEQPLPDELLERQDAIERLHVAIASLTPIKRHVVRRVLEGATTAEVAKELERKHDAVNLLHRRAIQDLKKRLVA